MEALLNKIKDAGLDATSVNGEEGIIFWGHVRVHIANNSFEQAQCFIISAEYRAELRQFQLSIDDLKAALSLLQLPEDAELVLSVRESLSERFIELGDYKAALDEYVLISNIAVENSYIDDYAIAILGMANLCRIYGDPAKALRYFQKIDSIDHAISTRSLRLRYKIGMLACYIDLHRLSAAKELIEECEELSILVSDKSLTGLILLLEARLELRQNNVDKALSIISGIPYTTGTTYIVSLVCLLKIELARCLVKIGKAHIGEMLLLSQNKKIKVLSHPDLVKELYQALSYVYEEQHKYQQALKYQKKAFRVESDLMINLPIGDLGTNQLRRLTRFELQLKLILSELENRELKETTESQQIAVAQLQQDVFTDPLTKLHNRRWLESKLKDLLLHETPFAFLVVDIDHFKSINDELSHLVGDTVTHYPF